MTRKIRSICLAAVLAGLLGASACGDPQVGDDEEVGTDDGVPGLDQASTPEGSAQVETVGTDGLLVDTQEGPVRGKALGTTRAFLGIPYAKPPVGALRWRAPEPPVARSGTFDARKFGPVCPQELPVVGQDPRSQEDCLRLNVWTPARAASRRLPVMVWIHGGSFTLGSGGDQYDGRKLSERGEVVVVTLNYRLGALGFLAHEALAKESGTSGNYGIMDQRAGLSWVRRNIAAFGGDPENVTLFGESAGGNSVCVHLASPPSRGLFQKAIVESGLCMKQTISLREASEFGTRLARDLGCGDAADPVACMRAVPARRILARTRAPGRQLGGMFYVDYQNAYYLQPIADGVTLPDQLPRLFAKGAVHPVPVLHGATADEGALFHAASFGARAVTDEAQFRQAVAVRFPAFVDPIVARYAPPRQPSWNAALARVTGDAFFVCSTRRMARALHARGVRNYVYRFTGVLDSVLFADISGRAMHSAEIPYLFANSYPVGTIPARYRPLAEALPGYWLRFARTGDPNGEGAVTWPAYDPAAKDELNLDVPIALRPLTAAAECALWDEVAAADG